MVRTTFEPAKLTELGKFWRANGGRNLGIVGDLRHVAEGFSYHLGKRELHANASSARSQRDKAGLTDAASAIDLGLLERSKPALRMFSRWLVAQCLANPAVRRDIAEIIYSADGKTVQRYTGADNKINTGPGQGAISHLDHTHISYFRDSEKSDKVAVFAPYFRAEWDPGVSAEIRLIDPNARKVGAAIREFGHDFGTTINMDDLGEGMRRARHGFGTVIDPSDVAKFLKLARKH